MYKVKYYYMLCLFILCILFLRGLILLFFGLWIVWLSLNFFVVFEEWLLFWFNFGCFCFVRIMLELNFFDILSFGVNMGFDDELLLIWFNVDLFFCESFELFEVIGVWWGRFGNLFEKFGEFERFIEVNILKGGGEMFFLGGMNGLINFFLLSFIGFLFCVLFGGFCGNNCILLFLFMFFFVWLIKWCNLIISFKI